jgi:uncharacterized protein YijF (DUF1287 family)
MRLAAVAMVLLAAGCTLPEPDASRPRAATPSEAAPAPEARPDTTATAVPSDFGARLALVAERQTETQVTYDPSYVRIAYPGGDVAPDKGVCADVVIRAYRAFGVDLQVLVHRDMAQAFSLYPQRWGLNGTDTNIDHRRVPNLETFFRRHGSALPVTMNPSNFKPGDLVSFIVAGSLPHIGIVSTRRSADGNRPLIVHNIGEGPKLEDVLFEFPIAGHFRYRPAEERAR